MYLIYPGSVTEAKRAGQLWEIAGLDSSTVTKLKPVHWRRRELREGGGRLTKIYIRCLGSDSGLYTLQSETVIYYTGIAFYGVRVVTLKAISVCTTRYYWLDTGRCLMITDAQCDSRLPWFFFLPRPAVNRNWNKQSWVLILCFLISILPMVLSNCSLRILLPRANLEIFVLQSHCNQREAERKTLVGTLFNMLQTIILNCFV